MKLHFIALLLQLCFTFGSIKSESSNESSVSDLLISLRHIIGVYWKQISFEKCWFPIEWCRFKKEMLFV